METIPALVGRTTAEGKLDYVNRRVVDYIGHEPGLIGMRLDHPDDRVAHAHPDDRDARAQNWSHALKTREPWEDTYRIRSAAGDYRWFYERSEPLLDRDGRVVCWYSVSVDVNDNREMEEALRNTRRKLSAAMQIAAVAEMSASIAHEINQPLASVVTNAHACQTWLSHDPPNLERAQATLERIIRDGHSAAEVVRRIRALFKEAAPVKAPLDINQIVAEVLRVLSDELRDNSIVVETELAVDLPRIAGDHVQIQQTLINLVHNATEAMAGLRGRPKSLVLKSRRQGEELLIQVRDHGVGIKDPALVFEPFFTTKESGMGMGLGTLQTRVPLRCRFHHLRVAFEELDHPWVVREQLRQLLVELQVVPDDDGDWGGHCLLDVRRCEGRTKPCFCFLGPEECKPRRSGVRAGGRPLQQVIEIPDRLIRDGLRLPLRVRAGFTKQSV